MRNAMLGGAALAALMGGAVQAPANAQVQGGSGFFGFVSGGYLFDEGPGPRFVNCPCGGEKGKPGDGLTADGKFGYAFGGGWDVAIGGVYSRTYAGDAAGNGIVGGPFRQTKGEIGNVAAEVGYTISGPGFGVRPALGVRYMRAIQESVLNSQILGAPITFNERTRGRGIGPQIGVDAAVSLTGSLSLVGGVETAFLYGRVRNTSSFLGVSSTTTRDTRMIWQIGGRLGLDWEVVPLFHVVAGYRLNYTDGATYETLTTGFTGPAFGRGAILEHGPFVRLAYNFGGSPGGAAPAAAPPPAPGAGNSFIVFFDFDRATLTSAAVQTIRQAAVQAQTGRSTRIEVTGHADRAGSDAYNMALSLRRANTVKDQLVREGIAANQIAVMGRGESQPLLPTADGVREPQNRRVEIVLG